MSSSIPENSPAKQSRRRNDNDKDEEGSNNTTRATVGRGDPARPFDPAQRLPTTGKLALDTPSNEPEGMVLEVFRY